MARTDKRELADSLTGHAAVLSELVAAHLEASLRPHDLGLGAFELLSAVKGSPSATQAELASRLGITPSSLCEAIRLAASKGLVEQEGSARDKRAKLVVLTRKGARVLDEALEALAIAEKKATERLPATKLATAVEALREAARSLSASTSS